MNIIGIDSSSIDAIFSVSSDQQAYKSTLAQTALSQGADLYTKGKYDQAVSAFKRSLALDPSADNAPQAYNLLATTYITQNKSSDAIKAYQASLRVSPNDENANVKLGNIYFSQKNYAEAEKSYKAAIKVNPTSTSSIYSLGQVYLDTNRFVEAEKTFRQVIRMDPAHHAGYYSLGQTFSKEGKTADAIQQFNKVISLNKSFNDVYVDLGSAYADLGQTDKAQEQVKILTNKDPNLVPLLTGYIDKVTKPKIIGASSLGGFADSLGPKTKVSELDPALTAPYASREAIMYFQFDKNMDSSSVQNRLNWSISKADGSAPGGAYDWGLTRPQTDVQIVSSPALVEYSQDSKIAKVTFKIQQNAGGDGTIDPMHIMLQFRGRDVYGNAMNPKADQYSGISKIV